MPRVLYGQLWRWQSVNSNSNNNNNNKSNDSKYFFYAYFVLTTTMKLALLSSPFTHVATEAQRSK